MLKLISYIRFRIIGYVACFVILSLDQLIIIRLRSGHIISGLHVEWRLNLTTVTLSDMSQTTVLQYNIHNEVCFLIPLSNVQTYIVL